MSLGHSWDMYYLAIAHTVSRKSKDPSTKCGCVIARSDRRPVSFGYNGFPQRVYDNPDLLNARDRKYPLIIHAEMNALIFAKADITQCICYTWPFMPCARCAVMLIQAGIGVVVCPWLPKEPEVFQYTKNPEVWLDNQAEVSDIFRRANVGLQTYPMSLVQKGITV